MRVIRGESTRRGLLAGAVGAALIATAGLPGQAQPRLVDQGRGVEGAVGPLAAGVGLGQLVQPLERPVL